MMLAIYLDILYGCVDPGVTSLATPSLIDSIKKERHASILVTVLTWKHLKQS